MEYFCVMFEAGSAGCSAFQVFLCLQVFLFSSKKIIGEKLFLYVFKAEACNGIGKALACDALLAEQKNCFFHNSQYFFFVGEYLVQVTSLSDFFAPSAADVDTVAVGVLLECLEWTFADTSAAVVTKFRIDGNFAIYQFCNMNRAVLFDFTDPAAFTFVHVDFRYTLTDDAQVVQVRFYAVVWTSAHCDFEFMRQFYITVADKETVMNLI